MAGSSPTLPDKLAHVVFDNGAPRGSKGSTPSGRSTSLAHVPANLLQKLLTFTDPTFRAWAVRIASNQGKVDDAVREQIGKLVADPSPDVLLQVAIASRKIEGVDALATLVAVLNHCGDDKLIPHIVWQNLHPLLEERSAEFLQIVERTDLKQAKNLVDLMPRIVDRVLGRKQSEPTLIAKLIGLLIDSNSQDALRQGITGLANKIQTGEVKAKDAETLGELLLPRLAKLQNADVDARLRFEATLLAATFKDPRALTDVTRRSRHVRSWRRSGYVPSRRW